MIREKGATGASIIVLLLVVSIPASMLGGIPAHASAAPEVRDLGNGNKTVSWNFSDPLDYNVTNVNLSGGAKLNLTSEQFLHDLDQDFASGGTWDTGNITVSGDSISMLERRVERVENGTFDDSAPWQFLDSPDSLTLANWESVDLVGDFTHSRIAGPQLQFDEMDAGVGVTWLSTAGGGGNPQHAVSATQDNIVYFEDNASARLDVDFKNQQNNWAGLYQVGGWDWSQYNTLSVWFNTSYTGPQRMLGYLNLRAGVTQWNSSNVEVTPGWKKFEFDLSPFGTNLSSITWICFRFTNVSGVNNVRIWIDDIWLYKKDNISHSASMYQEFSKDDYTDPASSVVLSFLYKVDSPANLTAATLSVNINGTLWASPPISALSPVGWTPMSYDIGAALEGKGLFNLSIVLSLSLRTPYMTTLNVQVDNVSLTIPYYSGGTYESGPLDLGNSVYFDQLSWLSSNDTDASITIEVRGGFSNNTSDGSWTPWEQHLSSPAFLLDNSTGAFIQYRVVFSNTNSSASATLDRIEFAFHRHEDSGRVETQDYTPAEILLGWRLFESRHVAPPGTAVVFSLSTNNGSSWTPVTHGSSLSSIAGNWVRVRADLTSSNTTVTPTIYDLNVTYEYRGALVSIQVTPPTWSGTADQEIRFVAKGTDNFSHEFALAATWTDDDPAGSVDSTGLYTAGRVGNWHVCASDNPTGLIDCANVTVSVGSLSVISVSPAVASVRSGELQTFTATGSDSDGNSIPLVSTQWSTDVGKFEQVGATSATFRAQGTPATGTVVARQGGVAGQASVTVIPSTTVYIQGTVPNQQKPEDDPPWSLDLSSHLPAGPSPNDLMWYLTGVNHSLYSVLGERRYGQHILWFSPKPDAYGSNAVTINLENRNGTKASQPMTVTIMPVNDAPEFYNVPLLPIKYGVPYTFNYSPYISDIDDEVSRLILTADDVDHSTVLPGKKVTYLYDESYNGRTVLVRLRISDGRSASETIQVITVSDNTPPHVVKPLPDVTMQEDTPLNDAFPEILSSYFADADGDSLYFSYGYSHLTITFWTLDSDDVHVRIVPEQDWFGVDFLTIRAKDSDDAIAEQTVRVTVTPVNDPPQLLWTDDVYVKYDVPYDLDLTYYVNDVDDPKPSLVLTTDRPDFTTVENFVVSLLLPTYLFGSVTSASLSLELSDGKDSTWSNITVLLGNNEPPTLKPGMNLPDVSFNEDQTIQGMFDLDEYFLDIDAGPQPIAYTVQSKTVTVSVDGRNNFVNFSAPADWFGQDTVHVKVSDGLGFIVEHFTVNVIPVNDEPVIQAIPDQDMGTGGIVAIDLRDYVHDVDNNITDLRFSTDNPRVNAIGYILILDYRTGGTSGPVLLTVNDTMITASRSFNVIVSKVPEKPPDILSQILWPWSLLLLLIIPAIGVVMYNRALDRRFSVEDVFMVGKEGRLIMHNTRHLRADRDEDVLAGMLTAIMMFIKDSFKEEGEDLQRFEFGQKDVLVERGEQFYLAAIYEGEPPETAPESLADFTMDIEEEFGPTLIEWSGDADDVRGLRAFMDAFVAHRRYKRGDWKKYAPRKKSAS